MPRSMSITRFQSKDSAREAAAEKRGAAGARRVHVVTFGCQMNKYDSLLVEGRFKARGFETTSELGEADVVLFNTCSVREHSEERTFSWLGELKRVKEERPDLVIGVMGCMAQRVEEEVFKRAAHVDIVVGTRRFQHLPELVEELLARRAEPDRWNARDMKLLDTEMASEVDVERGGEQYTGGLHGYLAVMRGCDLNCTYCIVPTTRGRVQSRSIDDLEREARWMVDQGARVITLLGQTVNSYGEDFPPPGEGDTQYRGRQGRPSLADLLYRLQEIEGLARLRLVTLHPAYVTREMCEAIRDCSKVDRFLPLPAQAGSDRILKLMKRGYTTDLYRKRVAMLREIVPDVELGSDWIVGFPSETDEEFEASEALLEEMGFVQNYVFKYDPRPTTNSAEKLEDDIATAEKKRRNNRLLQCAERVAAKRLEKYVGAQVDVFVEAVSERHPHLVQGRSAHNLPVHFPGDASLVGESVRVEVVQSSAFGLGAVPLEANDSVSTA